MTLTTNFLDQPPLDATQFIEQMREMQAKLDLNTFWPKPVSESSAFYSELQVEQIVTTGKRKLREAAFDTSYHWTRSTAPIGQMQIIESVHMTVPAEDWSRVRSPSRARRRMARGHRQNVRYYQAPSPELLVTGDTIVGHPETIRALTAKMAKDADRRVEKMRGDALLGRLG